MEKTPEIPEQNIQKPKWKNVHPVILSVIIIAAVITIIIVTRLHFNRVIPAQIKAIDSLTFFTQTRNMALVDAGQCMMGSNFFDDEQPIHQVQLDTFYIDKNEVTVAKYRAFCDSTKRQMPTPPAWGWIDNNPIVKVSWKDAAEYAKWIGARLPTESEWEYAARGGRKSGGAKYSGGTLIGQVAWYSENSGFRAHPVCTKKPNELDIYDMSGNVWEWCADGYNAAYDTAEVNGNTPALPDEMQKVIRGGGWFYDAVSARVANRRGEDLEYKSSHVGFRCAISRKK